MARVVLGCKTRLNILKQVLYDSQWVQNVWSYTMPELLDPSIGDEWLDDNFLNTFHNHVC